MNLTAGVTVVKDVVLTGTALADVIHAKLLVFHIPTRTRYIQEPIEDVEIA